MSENVKIDIQIPGNIFVEINKLQAEFLQLNQTVQALQNNTTHSFEKMSSKISLIHLNALTDTVSNIGNAFSEITAPGIKFQQSMAELSAITGIAGDDLKKLGKAARLVGKSSGLGASEAAEAFKYLASQIQVDKIGVDGLKLLQKETITLAQAAGLELPQAANAMAGAINQFGLEAKDASRVINVLAAGSKYGAAEIPDLAQAFKQAGSAAAGAGLNIEQLTGGLEVLSKNAIKGGEAGTAMRNIILRMQTVLGIDFKKTSLPQALEALKPKLNDTKFLVKTFGMENVNAAQFLIKNARSVDEMTKKVTGTKVAYEQAAINTDTYAHKIKKVKAQIDDFKISITNVTGSLVPYMEALSGTAVTVSQLLPLMTALTNAKKLFRIETYKNIGAMMKDMALKIRAGVVDAALAVKQWALNIAMDANPIGLIILGISALIGVIVLAVKYWDEIIDAIKRFNMWVLDLIDKVFPGAKKSIIQFFKGVWDWIDKNFIQPLVKAWQWLKGVFGFGDKKAKAEVTVTHKTDPKPVEPSAPDKPVLDFNNKGKNRLKNTANAKGNGAFSAAGKKEVNVHIEKLVDKIVLQVTHLRESTGKIRESISEALVSAVRDTEVAIS